MMSTGIDAVAGRLGHPLALAVLDHRVDVDVAKRHVAQVELAEDHHPGHPERDDVAGRGENACRIILRELGRLLGPAQGRVRPEGRAEPGVEDVGVLDQRVPWPQSSPARGRVSPQMSQPPDSPLSPGDVVTPVEGPLRGPPRCRPRSTRSGSGAPTRAGG